MTISDREKLARYDWLCKAFMDAYHNDAIDSPNPVNACLLHANTNYKTVQFVINIQEKADAYINLDAWIQNKSKDH